MSLRKKHHPQNHVSRRTSSGAARHWWHERLSSIALALLMFPFLIPFVSVLGHGYSGVVDLYRHSFHALVAIAFIATSCYHLQMGLRVVIDDYVHVQLWRRIAIIGNSSLAFLLAASGVLSILKIYLAA